jgi:hypothetical protein
VAGHRCGLVLTEALGPVAVTTGETTTEDRPSEPMLEVRGKLEANPMPPMFRAVDRARAAHLRGRRLFVVLHARHGSDWGGVIVTICGRYALQ